jgi:hypothetical protein
MRVTMRDDPVLLLERRSSRARDADYLYIKYNALDDPTKRASTATRGGIHIKQTGAYSPREAQKRIQVPGIIKIRRPLS